MNVVAINSSPRMDKGNTAIILNPFLDGMRAAGAEVDLFYTRKMDVKMCLGCFACWHKKKGECVQQDDMTALYPKLQCAQIWVLATPLYECGMTGPLKNVLDRTVACHYPGCRQEQPDRMVLVSSCGDWELERFDSLLVYMRDLCAQVRKKERTEFAGALLRPHAGAIKPVVEAGIAIDDILDAAREAGRQLIHGGQMDPAGLKVVSRALLPKDEFMKYAAC